MRPRRLVRYYVRRDPAATVVRLDVTVTSRGVVHARSSGVDACPDFIGYAQDETMLRDVLRHYRSTPAKAIAEAVRKLRMDVAWARTALATAESGLAAVLALRENRTRAEK